MAPGSTNTRLQGPDVKKNVAGEGLSAKGNQNKEELTPVLANKINKTFFNQFIEI